MKFQALMLVIACFINTYFLKAQVGELITDFEWYLNSFTQKNLNSDEFDKAYNSLFETVFVNEKTQVSDFYSFFDKGYSTNISADEFILSLASPGQSGEYPFNGTSINFWKDRTKIVKTGDIPSKWNFFSNETQIQSNLKVFTYVQFIEFKKQKRHEKPIYLTLNLFCYGEGTINCRINSIVNNYYPNIDDDKDGFLEKGIYFRDKCPGQYGTASGCPDQDGDGFYEVRLTEANSFDPFYDLCPMEFGTTQGCADQDADGILDKDERKECINIRGDSIKGPYSSYNGCPDTDHDGVPDILDNCKNEYGTINSESETINGCPNLDGDFLSDANDDCPCDKGPIETFGCPDQDQDGILDEEDNCPNEKGTSADGCVEEFYSRQNSEQVFDPDDPINFLEIIDNEILIIGTLNGMLGVLPINENEEAFNLSRANKRNVGVLLGVVYSDSGLDEGKVYVVSQRYGKPQKTELKINRGVAVEILETISASVKEFEKYEEEIRNKEIDVDTEDNQIFVQSSLEVEGGSNIPIRDTLSFQSEIDVDESVMTISKDGKYLAFAESKEDYDLRIWKRTNRKFKRLPQKWIEMENPKIKLKNGHFPRSLVFTKNGDRIFIGTQHGYLYSFKKR